VDRPSRVTTELTDEALTVRCRGTLVLWAIRRRVRVPREQISGARLVPRAEAAATLGIKLGGTYLTRRRLIGGVFTIRGVKGGRQWWAAPAGDPVLVIELHGHRWRRLVLRLPDDEQDALVQELGEPGPP
jgi:hypothetical protein